MNNRLRKRVGRVYWSFRSWWYQFKLFVWMRRLADPLWVARRCLLRQMKNRCYLIQGDVLDAGSGNLPYRHLFNRVDRYVATDMPPTRGVDAHEDALRLAFADNAFHAVLCSQVLEHVREPQQLIREASRVLRPGGALILTTPQVWGLHLEPNDYFRFTKYGLTHLAESQGLDVIDVVPTCGLWATLVQRVADTAVHHYAARMPPWCRFLIGLSLRPILLAGYWFDRLVGKHGDTLDNVLIARKPTVQGARTCRTTSLAADKSSLQAA